MLEESEKKILRHLPLGVVTVRRETADKTGISPLHLNLLDQRLSFSSSHIFLVFSSAASAKGRCLPPMDHWRNLTFDEVRSQQQLDILIGSSYVEL
jgi:hypothetical protein